ncbi:MAG: hypothetical protein JNJ49_17385 [Bdellovibrionaceae bacterium]|nr:hypothetical protein [Pseudobdellovibrionaceae bacterium]
MTRFATAVVLVLLIVAFQNCSNARFIQSMTGISGKGLGPAAVVGLGSNGAPLPPATPGVTVPGTPGGVADQTVAAALAECNALQTQAATLPLVAVNTSVIGQRGNFDLRSDGFDRFESNSGNFRILGLASQIAINAVSGNSGNLVICGMNVGQISNSNGNVLIVRGNVGDILNFSGNIKLIDGRVLGSRTNVPGNITEEFTQ